MKNQFHFKHASHLNKSRARHHRSLKLGSKLKYLNNELACSFCWDKNTYVNLKMMVYLTDERFENVS